jgi:iron complex outermembrane receptor protein
LRVDTDLDETITPGGGIANIQGGVRRGALSLIFGLANALEREYREHLSYQRDPFRSGVTVTEPGRNAFVSASWMF